MTVVHHGAVPRPDENGQKMRKRVTAGSSTQIKEENRVITNLIEVELGALCARRHVDLSIMWTCLNWEENE